MATATAIAVVGKAAAVVGKAAAAVGKAAAFVLEKVKLKVVYMKRFQKTEVSSSSSTAAQPSGQTDGASNVREMYAAVIGAAIGVFASALVFFSLNKCRTAPPPTPTTIEDHQPPTDGPPPPSGGAVVVNINVIAERIELLSVDKNPIAD